MCGCPRQTPSLLALRVVTAHPLVNAPPPKKTRQVWTRCTTQSTALVPSQTATSAATTSSSSRALVRGKAGAAPPTLTGTGMRRMSYTTVNGSSPTSGSGHSPPSTTAASGGVAGGARLFERTRLLLGHAAAVKALCLCNSSTLLASAGKDMSIRVRQGSCVCYCHS